jgi:hypothetical protein
VLVRYNYYPPITSVQHFLVSRTATAPLDRLKIFLITRVPDLGYTSVTPKPRMSGLNAITGAIARIYTEGGLLAFWTGNGLSVAKIFPESAIKFFTYESSVRSLLSCRHLAFDHSARNALLPSTGIKSRTRETLAASAALSLEESVESAVNLVCASLSTESRTNGGLTGIYPIETLKVIVGDQHPKPL